jgi:pimeloyl-ACP methyl ester carboxylesterase
MPNSGYSAPFAHTLVAPAQSTFHADHGNGYVPQDNNRDIYGFPIMSFEERFIIEFIESLDRQFGNVKPRIAAVMGGSLGGNMSLQLSRRKDKYSYLRTIVAWSPTCFKQPDGPARMMIGSPAGGNLINLFQAPEQDGTRHDYITTMYDKPLSALFGMPAQPEMWYGTSFTCKQQHILRSRMDHMEQYTPQNRQWTTRLNYEMTQFTFHEGDVYKSTGPTDKQEGPARLLTMTSKLLLAAGMEDDYNQVRNFSETMGVAPHMTNTPGTTLFIMATGHSIHDERPKFFATKIVDFIA